MAIKTKIKESYVDGFVIVAPRKKRAEYKKMAELGKKIWMKHGALDYKECVGDDLKPDMDGMKHLQFGQMTKAKPTDDIWFSFIVYKSKKHRDQVNSRVMKDPAMSPENFKDKTMPFDMKHFAYGGFKVVVGD